MSDKAVHRFESAEVVRDETGRQYHIGLAPGEAAPFCLLVGDPARAERVSRLFDTIEFERRNREYVTYTGRYRGGRLSVMATGMGCDNTEIALVEYCQLVDEPTFIRVGSSGALVPELELGDLVISSGAVKLENTTSFFVPEGYPALAHHEVVLALLEAAAACGHRHALGLTASASGFYGAQARHVPGFPPRFPDLPERLGAIGVKNMEMETAALFCLSTLRGVRAGAVCAIYANRPRNVFIDSAAKERAEGACIEVGLGAVEVLRRMDRARAEAAHWRPSHGLAATAG